MRILDADASRLDPADPVRRVAELEHVTGEAFDREILVHRADEVPRRLEDDVVIGRVRNRTTGGKRGQPGAAAAAQHVVHRIPVHVGRAMAVPRREAVGERANDVEIFVVGELRIRRRTRQLVEQVALRPFARRDLGDDLLGEYVERLRRDRHAIELAALDCVEQRRAFDELVARQRKEPRLRRATDRMARAAGALQERRDPPRGTKLAHELDVTDVDTKLQRCRRHECFELALLQPLFGG